MTSCARIATSIRFESTENEMAERAIRISEARSNLSVTAQVFADRAPENVEFLWRYLETARSIPSIHAMWKRPEISSPVPSAHLEGTRCAKPLALENSTITPAARRNRLRKGDGKLSAKQHRAQLYLSGRNIEQRLYRHTTRTSN